MVGAKHRHQFGITFRGGEHFFGFSQIHRHAGLTKNVFARSSAEIVTAECM